MKLSSLNTKVKLSTNALLVARGKNGCRKSSSYCWASLWASLHCSKAANQCELFCFWFSTLREVDWYEIAADGQVGQIQIQIAKSKAKRCTCLKLRPNLVLEVFVNLLVEIFVTVLVLVEIFVTHCCWWKNLSRETQQASCCWTGNRCKRCLQRSRPACISRQPGERLSFLNIEIDLLLQQLPL